VLQQKLNRINTQFSQNVVVHFMAVYFVEKRGGKSEKFEQDLDALYTTLRKTIRSGNRRIQLNLSTEKYNKKTLY
jgi:hypothetical protein